MSSGTGERTNGRRRFGVSGRAGRFVVKAIFVTMILFITVPVLMTFVASFGTRWTGVIPEGFVTSRNWRTVLGLVEGAGPRGGVISGLAFSAGIATGGMVLNVLIGVPIAYSITRYEFFGKRWVNTLAVLPVVPGVVLAVAFLRAYPEYSDSALGLIVGYALLKSPFMVLTVQSSFQSMNLQRIEESARSLGASWLRTFLTVIVPNAKDGIIAGSIITWTLAAAEFNFTFIVDPGDPQPFALFLYANITRSPVMQSAAAVSIYFAIVMTVILALQFLGRAGFTTVER